MKYISLSVILLLGTAFSSITMAEQVVEVISSINYEARKIVIGKQKYYLPKKVRSNGAPQVVIDINRFKKGMLVNVGYQAVKGKLHRILTIEPVAH